MEVVTLEALDKVSGSEAETRDVVRMGMTETVAYVAYQEAVWAGASADTLADMRADIIIPMVTSGELTLIQAESRFWRTLAEVRDNDM